MASAAIGYLFGSIPTGYWIGQLLHGIDIRKFGSGNLGATNVFRTLGWKAGVTTLVIDVGKGFLAVKIASRVMDPPGVGYIAAIGYGPPPPNVIHFVLWTAGIFAILGHSFSPFVSFHGGKGVATAAGVFLAILPIEAGIALVVFGVIFSVSRIVSLSSILASISLTVATLMIGQDRSQSAWTIMITLFVILRHRSNIVRIMNGTENRISFSTSPAAADGGSMDSRLRPRE